MSNKVSLKRRKIVHIENIDKNSINKLRREKIDVVIICRISNKEKDVYSRLQSLVNQETSIKYDIIIVIKTVSDENRNIIEDFVSQYPNIKLISNTEEIIRLLKRTQSKYITFSEDNFYWTEISRLQKQYNELEKDKAAVGVIGKVRMQGDKEIIESRGYTKDKEDKYYFPISKHNYYIPDEHYLDANYVIEQDIVRLSMIMIRSELIDAEKIQKLKETQGYFKSLEIPLVTLLIDNRNIKYIDSIVGTMDISCLEEQRDDIDELVQFIDGLYKLKEYTYNGLEAYSCAAIDNRIRRELYKRIKLCREMGTHKVEHILKSKYPDVVRKLLEAIKLGRTIEEDYQPLMVTVVCVTYNHENYIRQTLDGLLMQKTNFKFQVYVGEDCSLDNTREIVKEYVEKYPDLIIPFFREENIGSIRNFGDLCERVYSKYIAFCDGDDYWIDNNKLQKQFDFLENNQDFKGVSGRLRLDIPENWYLGNYYRKNQDGYYYQPDFLPDFKMPENSTVNINHIVMNNVTHATAIMVKVNHKIRKLPNWFYNSYMGDTPYVMLQIGMGKIKFTDDVVGVYRKHEGGVTSAPDFDTNMYNTRLDYISYLQGVREFFILYYRSFGVITIENRIKQEVANYLNVLIKFKDDKKILELFEKYPVACRIAMGAYLSFYNDSKKMTRIYSWEGNKAIARDSKFMYFMRPIIKRYVKLKQSKDRIKKWAQKKKESIFLKRSKKLCGLVMYLLCSLIPKNKRLWVFTSFRQKGYLDNSKYYYEYVKENAPEIKSVWLTIDKGVYNDLKSRGDRVYKATSLRGIWTMARAKIAVTDHFRMTDYPSILGYNYGTKIVQLWHGVGLKSMGDGKNIKNTNVPGVQYSYDLLPQLNDSKKAIIMKKIKYFRKAFYREMFEEYFMFVCPGQERIDMIGKMWNVPKESYFMAGHPRDIHSFENLGKEYEKKLIIYAPTYRMNADLELKGIELLVKNLFDIQKKMEELDCYFTIRLHPHTWRNYRAKIMSKVVKCNRINLDTKKDIYDDLWKYSIMISDYSSISFDLALLNRPIIYLCHDYDVFIRKDAGFNLDYFANTPGPKVYSWEDTLKEVEKYINNPETDNELREEVCKYFFDKSVNNIDNSKRITEEIKRRLKI